MSSLLQRWLPSWSRCRVNRPSPRQRTRPGIEVLEDRSVPSVSTGWSITGLTPVAVASDGSGNAYAVGTYPAGGTGEFVLKYSRAGALQWATPLNGIGSAGNASDLAVDSTGTSVYVTGMGGNTGSGSYYGYLTQVNAATGAVTWTKTTANQASGPIGTAVAVDSSGYVYAAMSTSITKYDVNGNQQWQATISSTSSVQATSIAISGTSVFVAGAAFGTVTIVTASGKSTFSAPGEWGFVAKITSSDQYGWGEAFGGNNKKDVGMVYDCTVAADAAGNAYAYDQFIGKVNFGNGFVLNGGEYNGVAYVLKLNSAGTTVWAKEFGNNSSPNQYIGPPDPGTGSIAVDSAGNIYFTGVANATYFSPPSGGYFAGGDYVVKLDTNGNFQWVTAAGSGLALTVDPLGDIYVAGGLTQLIQS